MAQHILRVANVKNLPVLDAIIRDLNRVIYAMALVVEAQVDLW